MRAGSLSGARSLAAMIRVRALAAGLWAFGTAYAFPVLCCHSRAL
jgi:hypothetical protein